MTITIPTGDLVGILTDVIPFGCTVEEIYELNCVRLEWDGTALHAMATDRFRIGWSTWQPGDVADGDEVQDDLFTEWGSGDEPWFATVVLTEASQLAKVFKLPPKEGRVPLTVEYEEDRRRLSVRRARDTGYTAITIAAENSFVEFPDLRAVLAKADRLMEPRSVLYTAKYLADFAKVRPRGPMELRFTEGLTHVSIGDRFVGAIAPTRRD